MLLKRLLLLGLLLIPGVAFGQGAVLQQGTVFAGHDAMWMSDGHIGDAGGPLGNGIPPVNPTFGLLPLGAAYVNSGLGVCQFSNYALTPYALLCSGFDGSGNALFTYTNIASPPGKVTFDINGINYPFPGAGDGDVLGPPSSVGGDLPAFNGTSGNLLEDSGILAADLVTSSGTPAAGDAVIWTGTGLGAKDAGAPPVLEVSTLTSLEALSTVTASQVLRLGVNTAGDAPPLLFTASGSPCTISGGDIGSQVTSSNGLCWLAQYTEGVPINPLEFGAKLNGATDDTIPFLAAINYAAALTPYDIDNRNGSPMVDCGGRATFLSATETIQNATGIGIQHCALYANPAVNWAGSYPNGVIYAQDTLNDRNIKIYDNYCDGGNVATCFTLKGHSAGFVFQHNTGAHFTTFFDGYVTDASENHAEQWEPSDAQYCVAADYTAIGFHLDGGQGDGRYTNNEVSNMAYPFMLGDTTDTASSSPGHTIGNKFEGNHPWQGVNAGVCDPALIRQNPNAILINPGSTGNAWSDLYLDSSRVALAETKNNTFTNIHYNYTTSKVYLTSWFDLIAQAAPSTFQGEVEPPNSFTGSTPLLLFACDGSGGNFWTISPSLCGTATANTHTTTTIDGFGSSVLDLGWNVGMNVADGDADVPTGTTISSIASDGLSLVLSKSATGTHTGDTIYVGNITTNNSTRITYESGWTVVGDSVSIAHHWGCSEATCEIGFNGTFSGEVESTIGQVGGNNIEFGVASNPDAFRVTADGNVAYPGTPPTCTTGCGSGYSVHGSNVLGHYTAGSGGSGTTIVITFAIQGNGLGGSDAAQAWGSPPNCLVGQPNNYANVLTSNANVTTLTVTLTAPIGGGNVLRWSCGEES